jgi:phosphoribosylglycinamide formyltransferase-1
MSKTGPRSVQTQSGFRIFQAKCEVLPTDSPDAVATKVHKLEYAHYPHVIEEVLKKI